MRRIVIEELQAAYIQIIHSRFANIEAHIVDKNINFGSEEVLRDFGNFLLRVSDEYAFREREDITSLSHHVTRKIQQ